MIFTEKEARSKICPMNIAEYELCRGSKCMWWKEVEHRVEREDHSGGRELLNGVRIERHTKNGGSLPDIIEDGPMINRVLILEARGMCGGIK